MMVVMSAMMLLMKRWESNQRSSIGGLHQSEESLVLLIWSSRGQKVSVRFGQN
jgi:hypothetical protein